MGYSTDYRLFCSDNDLLEELVESNEHADEPLGWLNTSSFRGVYHAAGCGKWYEHEEEMKIISKKHKSVLFTLHGEGEDSGDLWRKYFLNGKMQLAPARIEYDDFDSSKLK